MEHPGISQTVGKDSVVMFAPSTATVGDGSIVIGPTDNHGNTILARPMIVGRGAHGGPGDIVIGAGAGSSGQSTATPPPAPVAPTPQPRTTP